MHVTDLDRLGRWTVYSDPRVFASINFKRWTKTLQVPFLLGQRSWEVTPEWSDAERNARQKILDVLKKNDVGIEIENGVARISDPQFVPLDDLTMQTCRNYRLVPPAAMKRGIWCAWKTNDRQATYWWIETAEPFRESEWQHGVPLIRTRFLGDPHDYAMLGRLDVQRVDAIQYAGRTRLQPVEPDKPRAWMFEMNRPRWKTSVKAASAHVAGMLPRWEEYLALSERAEKKKAAAEAEARYEAEMEPFRRQLDEDVDAGMFDDLL